MEKFILIIFGPTGVGKTDCANYIAQCQPIEIINMDMGQLYTPLTIGTAKPDWRQSPIPHHLFDVIDRPVNFTVAEYRAHVASLIEDIWQRGKLPVLVGGSGFYLRSLLFPPQAESTDTNILCDDIYPPDADLWHELYLVDPERAHNIKKNDFYRIKRALAIWHATGKKPSSFVAHYNPIAPFKILCLTRDRNDLYNRINERVDTMLAQGWLNEVQNLLGTPWQEFIMTKKIIGYDDLISYLQGPQTPEILQQHIAIIQQRTRHYAKRQMTYWRMIQRELDGLPTIPPHREVNLTTGNLDLYIKKLLAETIG